MKVTIGFAIISILFLSCKEKTNSNSSTPTQPFVTGTWRLITGMVIEKGDTTTTDYTKNTSFIKIINNTHFAFLQHDLKNGKDSAVFAAGGGRYSLSGNSYTEHLEYCTAREWEGHDFTFTVSITNDTLVQQGAENVESAGIDRINMETYVRVID